LPFPGTSARTVVRLGAGAQQSGAPGGVSAAGAGPVGLFWLHLPFGAGP